VVRLGVVVVLAAMAFTLMSVGGSTSKLPETFSMMQGRPDFGGGVEFAHDGHGAPGAGSGQGVAPSGAVSVEQLRGPRDGLPDRTFTLTAQEKRVTFPSGQTFDAWTFGGQVPGPELRVKEGELVEIKLVNNLHEAPVSVHWHGVDVPNGEDGVAGVTQDAVQPGQSYTYRFRAEEVGTRWYHSHQQASEQVNRGLFGPLVIEPRQPARAVDVDKSVVLHDWTPASGSPIRTFGSSDVLDRQQLTPGSKVRLRLVNTSNATKRLSVTGVPYRVTAYDGTDVHEPAELTNSRLLLPGAGRYDVEFTMPSSPVRVADIANPSEGIVYSPDGKGDLAPDVSGPELDPLSYGKPADTPFDAGSQFDRNFTLAFDVWLGFYNGSFALRQTINGQVFPDAPMHMVREGELVKMTFINRGEEDHPMHLHGHHFLVLGKNGNRPTGSPIWLDTVNVAPGETVEIGFRADNPGIWMDHCHNLTHTALGMVLHLTYENVTSPYLVGGAAHNHPD
jgi:FtsP/CotA-like multicopper oxidase with cupredoxin domain